MRKIISVLALFAACIVNAQEKEIIKKTESRFAVGIHYQPALDKNLLRENGIGIDARIRAVSFGAVSLQGGLSGTYEASKGDFFSDAFVINPAVFAGFSIFDLPVKPYIGIGYVYYRVKIDESDYLASGGFDPYIDGGIEETYDFNGFNIHPGVRFHFAKILYADLGYNYVSGKDNINGYANHTSRRNQMQIGFGFRF